MALTFSCFLGLALLGAAVDGEEVEEAVAGDNVLMRIRNSEDESVKQGSIICEESNPCPVVKEFEAKLNVLNCKTILSGGYQCMLHLHNALIECSWKSVVSVKDIKTGKDVKMPFVRTGQQVRPRG